MHIVKLFFDGHGSNRVTNSAFSNTVTSSSGFSSTDHEFNSLERFLYDVLCSPDLIAPAKLDPGVTKFNTLYIRSKLYAIYKLKEQDYAQKERELWRFINNALDGFELCNQRPCVGGKQVRLVTFPPLESARNSFRRRFNFENINFD